jgi:phosphate starvation-inducible PhoH-like protein
VFNISGQPELARQTVQVLQALYEATASSKSVTAEDVHLALQHVPVQEQEEGAELTIRTRKTLVRGRSPRQREYLRKIMRHDINFGIGPAGTGKTYLAVACAAHALENDEVSRIVLVRPAVEAGERLGFLPGDLGQKVDPYLRPLYDALYEMFGFDKVAKLLDRNIIELAPLAYMRGRTLNESFVILDEAQNTTADQMKMFLTRIGFGSTAVITGDITQTDLPRGQTSGLRHVLDILGDVPGISFTRFKPQDVVRHPLVQKIVEAYEAADRSGHED